MRWAGRVTGGRREKDEYNVLVRKVEGKRSLCEVLDLGEAVILKWNLKK
jgi:hypothetical protein